MKKFIAKSLIFALVISIIQVFIFYIIHSIHKFSPYSYYYSRDFNEAFKSNRDFDVLVLGSSRPLSAISREVFERITNKKMAVLACSSSNVSTSRLVLEGYLEKCVKKPEVVLLEMSWFSFSNTRLIFHRFVGDIVMEIPSLVKYFPRYYDKFWTAYINAAGGFIKSLFKEKILGKKEDVNWGKLWFETKDPNRISYRFDIKKFEEMFPKHRAGVDELLFDDFMSIVNLCKKKGMKLIVFTTPEDYEFSSMQEDRDKIINIYKELWRNGEIFAYLNYSLFGEYYNKKYEYWLRDSHHISENRLFTEVFALDIMKNLENSSFRIAKAYKK